MSSIHAHTIDADLNEVETLLTVGVIYTKGAVLIEDRTNKTVVSLTPREALDLIHRLSTTVGLILDHDAPRAL